MTLYSDHGLLSFSPDNKLYPHRRVTDVDPMMLYFDPQASNEYNEELMSCCLLLSTSVRLRLLGTVDRMRLTSRPSVYEYGLTLGPLEAVCNHRRVPDGAGTCRCHHRLAIRSIDIIREFCSDRQNFAENSGFHRRLEIERKSNALGTLPRPCILGHHSFIQTIRSCWKAFPDSAVMSPISPTEPVFPESKPSVSFCSAFQLLQC